MRTWTKVSLMTVVLPLATTSKSNSSPEADAKAVAALDTKYQAAVKVNDAQAMDQILAHDFVLVTGPGKVYNKADATFMNFRVATHMHSRPLIPRMETEMLHLRKHPAVNVADAPRPNHALQRTRPSCSGCNPRVPRRLVLQRSSGVASVIDRLSPHKV
jgi:hypothetical protein